MKRTLILIAFSLLLPSTSIAQGGGGERTKTRKTTPKPAVTKSTTAERKPTTSRPDPNFRPQNPHIELVQIPPGTFNLGSNNGAGSESPAHQVTISYSFYIGKYEVTQTQWQAVMGNNPSRFKDCGGNCPVEQVSLEAAHEFVRKLNQMNDGFTYRLPSEAEWEYACRAGTTGDYAGDVDEMAWHYANSGKRTHAVGQKRSNAWGLADMHGNVLEWCEDWYRDGYDGAPTDGSAWFTGSIQTNRVARGGSWFNQAPDVRSTIRYPFTADFHDDYIGLRVVAIARTQ